MSFKKFSNNITFRYPALFRPLYNFASLVKSTKPVSTDNATKLVSLISIDSHNFTA